MERGMPLPNPRALLLWPARTTSLFLTNRKAVNQTAAFVLDAVHQAARPNKFRGQLAEPEKNHQHSRPRRDHHNGSCKQQNESSEDEEDPADLLDLAKDHGTFGTRLCGGEGGIRTPPYRASYHIFGKLHGNCMNRGDRYDLACLYFFNSFTRLGQNSDTNRDHGCQASLEDGSVFPILGRHRLDNLVVL